MYKKIRNIVYNFETKYKEGFLFSEIQDLLNSHFPSINVKSFNDALFGNTCMIIDGNTIVYHTDLEKAIRCGVENRGLKPHEWD